MGCAPAATLPRLVGALGLLALLVGCGYHLVGTATYLPTEYQNLYVKPFVNQSGWADVDQRLGEAVSQEWVRRRRFHLVDSPEQADLVLQGTIAAIMILPVSVDSQGRATEYQMNLTVAAQLVDPRGDKPVVLWEDKAFSRRTSYQVEESAVDYFDRQVQALEMLARDLASALVSAVLEGF
jgi:hypothetical protein